MDEIAAKGGLARAKKLPARRRSEIARQGALERWDRDLPRATHAGDLEIGGVRVAAAVLETRKRVLTQETFLTAVGRAGKAKGGKGSSRMVDGIPPFLAAENLKPFISDDLLESTTPIVYRSLSGARAYGYDAILLPKVCEVYLTARDKHALLPSQKHIAVACELLMRGLAHVGIVALVDEATGYQHDRDRDDLNRVLAEYISRGLLPWTRRFPDAFFRQLYRLLGWDYREGQHKRNSNLGKLINKYVYDPLPKGVLPELRRLNPPAPSGYRRHKHHQFLTEAVGHPHLDRQIVAVTTLMQAAKNRRDFDEMFQRVFPRPGQQERLPFPENGEE